MVFSGSQDSIGLVYPGLNRLEYAGKFWPESIISVGDHPTLDWIEQHLFLIPLGQRNADFDVLKDKNITSSLVQALAAAADACWQAIREHNLPEFGRQMRASFEAQTGLFPGMITDPVRQMIEQYRNSVLGWKLSGAGGGGYLVLVNDRPVSGAIQLKIRRAGV
jgi:galactokinase/mevalonate kinase-like predicted kinase